MKRLNPPGRAWSRHSGQPVRPARARSCRPPGYREQRPKRHCQAKLIGLGLHPFLSVSGRNRGALLPPLMLKFVAYATTFASFARSGGGGAFPRSVGLTTLQGCLGRVYHLNGSVHSLGIRRHSRVVLRRVPLGHNRQTSTRNACSDTVPSVDEPRYDFPLTMDKHLPLADVALHHLQRGFPDRRTTLSRHGGYCGLLCRPKGPNVH